MKVEAQFFSRLRDIVGSSTLDIELPPGATLGDLLAWLYERYPELRRWDTYLLTAVGLDYTDRTRVLQAGEVVSIMPPVQGG